MLQNVSNKYFMQILWPLIHVYFFQMIIQKFTFTDNILTLLIQVLNAY